MGRYVRRSKNRHSRFYFLHYFIVIVSILASASLVFFYTDSLGLASSLREMLTSSQIEIVETSGAKIVRGDYSINTPGEKLEDIRISGDLYLGSGIGDGRIDLINVTVDGAVIVQGGGRNSIYMQGCLFREVRVNRPEGIVSLVASADTVVQKTILETGADLFEDQVDNSKGFQTVEIFTIEPVRLNGYFDLIEVRVQGANLEINSTYIHELSIARTGAGTVITYPDYLKINRLYIAEAVFLIGELEVQQAVIATSASIELGGSFTQILIRSEAGILNFLEYSTADEIIVAAEAFNNIINLENETTVLYLELNEAVEVKGDGFIEKVFVNAPGSTIEQIPADIEFAAGLTIYIAGYEISSSEMLDKLFNNNQSANESSDSKENDSRSSAGASGPDPKPEPKPDPKPEPKPETKPDPEPDPDESIIKVFIVEEGLIADMGKKMVIIVLNVPDQKKYRVIVGASELDYSDVIDGFRGEVDKQDALIEKVVITGR